MDKANWMDLARSVIPAAIAAFVTWLTVRQSSRKNKTDAAQGLMNDLQEDRTELRSEIAKLKSEVQELRADGRRRDERERLRDDFVQELRTHIREGKGPPPPDWPELLRTH